MNKEKLERKDKIYKGKNITNNSSLWAVSMSPSDPKGLLDVYLFFNEFGGIIK